MIFASGCSRKKDKFINRNWHAVTTEFNTLYNGDLALTMGKEQIAETYSENFWEILPVERMQISEEIMLPGSARNEFFKTAEEKATKAIQRHSMLINGREKNPQIDEAYLLLGKARYFDQRFIPALEAFNYILHKYPASNTINHAQIWREKTNIRLENNKLAIKNLKRILEAETLKDRDRADANAMLAQAYINTGVQDSAVSPIKTAARYTKKDDEKGRYYFIEGQLYDQLQMRDSANLAFDKVIELNRKTPREYLINAHLGKARNFNFSDQNPSELLQLLQDLEENRENKPFLDKIYFQIAEYYNHLDSTDLATVYYNKSLKSPSKDNFLQSVNYETLGNMNFNKAQYRQASAYYDSTLTKIPVNTRDHFFISRKRENLKDVILYEEIAEGNDSILILVEMNTEERLSYFTNFTEGLKEEAIAQAKQGKVTEAEQKEFLPRGPGLPPAIGDPASGNVFYFYNPVRIASGMQDFLRTWGPRDLKDNWRLNSGGIAAKGPNGLDEISGLLIDNNPKFDPQIYLDQIPGDPTVIDSLTNQRNDAYYRLGLIYKEKFGENKLASEKLRSLLGFTSEERFVAPANYYLYQISQAEGAYSEAEKYKQTVLTNYPESRFAAAIRNPGLAIELEDQAQKKYEELYELFEQGEYQQVIALSTTYGEKFKGDDLLPRIELLKALATGRIYGILAYKDALNYVALNYPQTDAGKKAQELYNTSIPKLENDQFEPEINQSNIKLLYSFKNEEKEQAGLLKEKLEQAILDLGYKDLSTSIDVYNSANLFVMVHGMEDLSRAEGFAELLKINTKYKVKEEPIVISSGNYRVVQLHKNLDNYIEFKNK
jgi:tetratricopeptide (TPR) repeat protein